MGTIPALQQCHAHNQDPALASYVVSAHDSWPAEIVDSMAWSAQFLGAFPSTEWLHKE